MLLEIGESPRWTVYDRKADTNWTLRRSYKRRKDAEAFVEKAKKWTWTKGRYEYKIEWS